MNYDVAAEKLAMGGAQGASGGAMGMVLGGVNSLMQGVADEQAMKDQYFQQLKLNNMSQIFNKDMYNFQMGKQLEFWNKTNYAAQVEQLRKAGLNPALLYGKGGGMGASTGSASAGNIQSHAGSDTDRMQLGLQRQSQAMQMSLLASQKANIDADTKVKEAQAVKTSGVDTKLAEANIGQVTESTKNTKLEGVGIAFDNELKELEVIYTSNITDEKISKFESETKYAEYLASKLKAELPTAGDIAQAQLDNLRKDIETKSQGIKESDAKIKYMKDQINVSMEQLKQANVFNLRDYRLEIQKINNEQIRNATYEAYYELEREYKEKNLQWEKDKFVAELGGRVMAKLSGYKSGGNVLSKSIPKDRK